jgi:hypothetical protein
MTLTSDAEWAEFERLKEFLKGHSLEDILAAASDQAFNEAAALRFSGYPETAEKLDYLADVLVCLTIPEVGVLR